MTRERKETLKQSIAIDGAVAEWVQDYATKKGITYTAAVNSLLSDQIDEKKRERRIARAREKALIEAERRAAGLVDPGNGNGDDEPQDGASQKGEGVGS